MNQLLLVTPNVAFVNEKGKGSCIACHIIEHNDVFYTRDNLRLHHHFELNHQVSKCA